MKTLADLKPRHFLWQVAGRIARVKLDRPERKNPLTFDSYAELLGNVSEDEARRLTGMLTSFRSNWEGRE